MIKEERIARNNQIAKDAKWISENIGANVAVEFLKSMEARVWS